MKNIELIFGLEELNSVAKDLSEKLKTTSVLTFTGPLGAGKTTLIRELLYNWGVSTEEITSPTFTYLNIYRNSEGKTFYHFDLYRIAKLDEFLMAGFDEYLYLPNSMCLIEWPSVINPLLKYSVCHINIDYHNDKRKLTMECK